MSAGFADKLNSVLLNKINDGTLVLPMMHALTNKIKKVVQETTFDAKAATALIDKDPVLAALLLQKIQASSTGRQDAVDSIRIAVSRLELRDIKSYLVNAASNQVFASSIPQANETLQALIDHALLVALFSQDLAGIVGCPSESAYLAGLLHDIGQIIVAIYLIEVERSLPLGPGGNKRPWIDYNTWVDVIHRIHQTVSSTLAKKWGFPSAIQEVIATCHDFDSASRQAVSNVVRFADALALRDGVGISTPDQQNQIMAQLMIGRSMLGVDEEVVERLSAMGKQTLSAYNA